MWHDFPLYYELSFHSRKKKSRMETLILQVHIKINTHILAVENVNQVLSMFWSSELIRIKIVFTITTIVLAAVLTKNALVGI